MNQAFECPNCGAPLVLTGPAGAVRCSYCLSTVIVPEALRLHPQAGTLIFGANTQNWIALAEVTQEIQELLAEGRKIEAIRLYKQRSGAGLKEAKEAVERIEHGEPLQLNQGLASQADRSQVYLPEIEAELRQLLRSGGKIEAIKRYREVFGAGLSESRDAVEVFANGEDLTIPIGWGQDERSSMVDSARALAQVTVLVQQGERAAAIQAYRTEFDSSLQEAEQVVDRLGQAGDSDPAWIVAQVQTDLANRAVPHPKTGEEKRRAGSCLYAGVALFVIAAMVLPLLLGLAQAGGSLQNTWNRLNPAAYARQVASFGGEGTGPGHFSDPRAVAVGRDGSLYVGDYQDGRIQRFDSRGQFLNQWFTLEESYLGSLAVDRNNQVYAVYRGQIWRFDGNTGEVLAPVPDPGDHSYDYVALTPDGGLLAVSSGEDLVRLDKTGRVQWIVPEAISSISGDSELDTRLAVDGLGNIYALGTFNSAVFKFSPEGRFLNRWGSAGDEHGQFRAAHAIAVDGYGRVAVSDIHGVQVFAGQDGRYLDRFNVPGVAFALAFDEQNDLYVASNDRRVYHYRLREPQPIVNRPIQPKQMVFRWEY